MPWSDAKIDMKKYRYNIELIPGYFCCDCLEDHCVRCIVIVVIVAAVNNGRKGCVVVWCAFVHYEFDYVWFVIHCFCILWVNQGPLENEHLCWVLTQGVNKVMNWSNKIFRGHYWRIFFEQLLGKKECAHFHSCAIG